MKKKFTFLIAAIALLSFLAIPNGMWGQTTYKLQQVNSVEADGLYVFEQSGYVMNNTVLSSALQTTNTYLTTGLTGTETYVWTLETATNGFYMKNVSLSSNEYLKNTGSSTSVSFGTKTSVWAFNFQTDNTVYIQNKSNSDRFLGYTSSSSYVYKAYATNNLNSNSYPHAIKVYKLVEEGGGGSDPSMSVSTNSIDFGSNAINPSEPYTETFSVTFANLTQPLSISVGSGLTGVSVSPGSIAVNETSPKQVTVSYNPTSAGSISGTITISSNNSEVTAANVTVTGSAYDPATVDTYEKYTGAIVEGDYVIYANNNALKNTLNNGPRFNNESVTPTSTSTSSVITNPDASIIWHIAPIENTSYWTIYNTDINKYAGGTDYKNQGALLDDITDLAKWEIYYQNSILYIANYGRSQQTNDPNNKYIRQNGTSGWATYGSGTGAAPQLYKKVIANQVAMPTFSVEAGTYFETKSVELSCTTDGADIYYTTDGTTPSSTHGTKYTTAISVSSNMTIKAIAVKSGMADSDVATAAYVIQLPYSTIPAIFAAATSTSQAAKVTFGGWLVTGINGGQAFVTDGTNGLIIYQSSHGFAVGNTLTGTVDCNIVLFNTSAEITGVTASNTNLTIGSGTATPNVTTIDALGSVNTGSVVTLNNLNYNGSVLSDGTNEITPFNTLYSDAAYVNGETYNITGVFFQNNTEKRILPRSSADIVEVTPQHEDRTLTINADSHVTDYFIFDEADQTESYTITNSTATIQDGTTVLVSLDIEDGYVVDEITVTYGSSQSSTITTVMANVEYTFTMPAANATLAVTTKEAPVVTTYTLVSTQADLMPGKHYIIVGSNAGETEFYAMGEQNGNFRSAVLVTKVGDNIQGTDDVCEFVLSGDATQGWSFYDISTSMYLKAVNGNELASTATLLSDNYCYWTFDFNVVNTDDAIELIQSNKYTDRFINFNNSTNPKRFANYKTSSNQRPVSIYVKDGDKDLELYSPTTLGSTNQITVPANGKLTVQTNGSLTNTVASNLIIEDGGQLITPNAIAATVQKNIGSASANWENASDGWYFIASPVSANVDPATVNMITDDLDNATPATATYDLYYLDPTAEKAWKNYRNSTFNLVNGKGYLYASKAGITPLSIAGEVKAYTAPESVDVVTGWNLIGNPFTFNVYASQNYYKMNENGTAITPVTKGTETIAPCTGIVVQADSDGSVTFSKEAPAASANNGNVEMVLTQTVTTRGGSNAETLDNAIVSFNENSQLEKFYFGNQNANIYIPQGNEEYAIVSTEAHGEMPVSFKANQNGQYTITVNTENVEMGYLHLVDNMTGADIDLLNTPSYTFNARVDDYTSRFKLVFSANGLNNENGNDDFAFLSNGHLIIANDGEATLQVIDITGRILSSEVINGSCSKNIDAATGVYVLRLVNGSNVKTQKVIIK